MLRLINYCLYGIVSILALACGQKIGKCGRRRKRGLWSKLEAKKWTSLRLESICCFSKSVQPSE